MNPTLEASSAHIAPDKVHETIAKRMLADGFDFVLDLEKSEGVYLYDSRHGKRLLDFFSFFATNPVGMNHPGMKTPEFTARLLRSALHNPSNSDVYTVEMAEFVETFATHAMPAHLPHLFLVAGGTLGVENALKAAFDWKVRKNFARGYREERGHQVLHFEQAFHGRSGYTLSLTNTTDPRKTAYFPKFDWPRVLNPKVRFPLHEDNLKDVKALETLAIAQMRTAFERNKDDIAAIIIEPIQGEGGDNHFRTEFFQELRRIADEYDAILVFDEVQTGLGLTGKWWAYQHHDPSFSPDIVCFAKKMQVGGIFVSKRIDDIEHNVFKKSGRINSTWGGSLVDMVRCTRILEIMEEEKLVENSAARGAELLRGLQALSEKFPFVTNARGQGLMCAVDLPDAATRDRAIDSCFEDGMIVLRSGVRALRFRPTLNVDADNIAEGLRRLEHALAALKK